MNLPKEQTEIFSVKISVQNVYRICLGVFCCNLFFLFGTWLSKQTFLESAKFSVQLIIVLLDLTNENIVASWYASMLYFSIAIIAFLCFLIDNQHSETLANKVFNSLWIIISAIFFTLSFDEMGSFHEVIGETALLKKLGDGISTGWYLFYAFIAIIGLIMLLFFFVKFRRYKIVLSLSFIGVILLLSNPFQEQYEMSSWQNAPNPATWKRPMLFLLIEEGSEIFASFFLFVSFIVYLLKKRTVSSMGQMFIKMEFALSKHFLGYQVFTIIALGILMQVVYHYPWTISGRSDTGLPQNWFPCIASFSAFIICLYFDFSFKKKMGFLRSIYIILAFVCLSTSIYFGSNMYYYDTTFIAKIKFMLFGAIILIGTIAILEFKGYIIRVLILGWITFFALSIYCTDFNATVCGYVSFSFLLIAFLLHYKRLLLLKDGYHYIVLFFPFFLI
ncbi:MULTISPECIES: hypothetical protein [unclassified Arcicella]|uniref:hypothetical protein n=1 Tax=unclassified Arcicella TaxID=2644986 RepID=UPI002862E510|nr:MULTISPECIES: hypothetical protein [unclassified Arcicella]MDR6562076.1 hypothetical protein [Arcicella sp. BE51]MDR6811948.1 hypothetical protein [Arcicella sp. BE140]MDR6822978.1 hypothetical protein [Arcicella sp. BE139]